MLVLVGWMCAARVAPRGVGVGVLSACVRVRVQETTRALRALRPTFAQANCAQSNRRGKLVATEATEATLKTTTNPCL